MKTKAFISNKIFMTLNKNKYYSYLKACENPKFEQKKYLLSLVGKTKNCEFGKLHSFSKIHSVKDFQNRVPLSSYEDYYENIFRIMNGEQNILCSEAIKYFALSSGSSKASKFIPYTNSLKKEFSVSVNVWIYDLLRNFKSIKYGTQFWIITPHNTKINFPKSKIPIGFENDAEYFGKIEKNLIRSVMCLPDAISKISDSENYFYLISYFLLNDKEVRIISVWNPNLLIAILKFIKENFLALCKDIEKGKIHLPNSKIKNDKKVVNSFVLKKSRRGNFLANLKNFNPNNVKLIWKKLELISCWTDAWANIFVDKIKNLLPEIHVQGKGLLATEGIISFPIKDLEYPLLSVKSHFYEFLNINDKKIYLADELKIGEKYELIITGGGGFYRYRLNDIIQVKGYFKKTPMIKFLGKTDIISDLCGEKLNENFVSEVFKIISEKFFKRKSLMFLAAHKIGNSFIYVLYLEKKIIEKETEIKILLKNLDTELMKNFHYKHCRNMKQIEFPKIKILTKNGISKILKHQKNDNILSTEKINYLKTKLLNPNDFEGKMQ